MNNWNGLTVKEPRLYNIWINMIQRCENPQRHNYKNYGGRGISVCKEWHDFTLFVSWAKENGYSDDLTIDRKNTDGNYEPTNCRWSDITEQANNKRSNIVLSCCGVTGTVKQWSELLGISQYTIYEWVNVHGKDYAERLIIENIQSGKRVHPTVVKHCVKCGSEFSTLAMNANAKYCPPCRTIATNEKYKRYRERKKANCGSKVVEK